MNGALTRWERRLFLAVVIIGFFAGGIWTSKLGAIYGPDSPQFMGNVFFPLALGAHEGTQWIGLAIRVLTLGLVVALYVWGPPIGRLADLFFLLTYVWIAISNNLALNTEPYGTIVILGNLIGMAGVVILWGSALISGDNRWDLRRASGWRYWIAPLVILAYLSPMNAEGQPGFGWFAMTHTYGTWFCFTTPVVVGFLTLIYPNTHRSLLGLLSFIGLVIGLMNWFVAFAVPSASVWLSGVLHIPLVIISAYGLLLPRLIKSPDVAPRSEAA